METFVFEGVLVRERKGFSAICLDVDVASQGRTEALAKKNLTQAVQGYVETALGGNLPVLRPVPANERPGNTSAARVVERFRLRVNLSVKVCA